MRILLQLKLCNASLERLHIEPHIIWQTDKKNRNIIDCAAFNVVVILFQKSYKKINASLIFNVLLFLLDL